MEQKKPVKVFVDEESKKAVVIDSSGRRFNGRVRIRPVICGKKCKECPHKYYKYAVWRDGKKIREKYLGVAKAGS